MGGSKAMKHGTRVAWVRIVVAVFLMLSVVVWLSVPSRKPSIPEDTHSLSPGGANVDPQTTHTDGIASKPSARPAQRFRRTVRFETDFGAIVWGLHDDAAPKTTDNIVALVTQGFYNNSCIYRYEAGFVMQGGGCGGQASRQTVPLEYKLPNIKHSVAMARSNDPHSGGSEWFINLNDNSEHLGPRQGGGYAVFAHVLDGFLAIDRMMKLPTHHAGLTMFNDPQPRIRGATVQIHDE
jgi:peptidyl-prolyl cis-trans isomerase B (cyclophilin B)